MMQRVPLLVILSASITITILANSSQAFLLGPLRHFLPPKNIYKPPDQSNISEIETSCTAWVKADVMPTIEAFRRNVNMYVKSSDTIQKYCDIFKSNRTTTRDIVFPLLNDFLTNNNHPDPADLANVFSKIASLSDPVTLQGLIEADVCHLPKLLLINNRHIDRSTAQTYVNSVAGPLAKVTDENDTGAIWQALLDGYVDFLTSQGFDPAKDIEEFLVGLMSALIALLPK